MADILIDGKTKVYSVPSIANKNAPTTTELNAGTDITSLLTADGLVGFKPDTADVDNSSLASTFDTKIDGRASYSGTLLRMKKQDPTSDAVYNTMVKGYATNIVVRRGVAQSTAWGVGNKVSVYPSRCGEVADTDPEPNSVQKYEIPIKISDEPSLRATVA